MQQCIGTPRYMAPEVALGQAYTEKVDVYSFSLIVWEMISDEVPYDTITNKRDLIQMVAMDGVRPSIVTNYRLHPVYTVF